MAYRICDLTLPLMVSGGQPGTCTCGPASGNKPCAEGSSKPTGGGSQPTRSNLNVLLSQLRESILG